MPSFESLDKYYEADEVAVRSNGTPGTAYRDLSIPENERWEVSEFGGSASIDSTEVELLYSEDNGSAWTNPYDDGTTKIRCIHLSAGNTSKIFLPGLLFTGGSGHILRILCKNYNDVNTAEIAGWINGQRRIE